MTSEACHFCDIYGVTEANIKCIREIMRIDGVYYSMFVIKIIIFCDIIFRDIIVIDIE